jgi:hypothetical protein
MVRIVGLDAGVRIFEADVGRTEQQTPIDLKFCGVGE